MKTTTKAIMSAAAMSAAIVGLAYATPIVNLVSPLFSVGQHAADIRTHGVGRTTAGESFEACGT